MINRNDIVTDRRAQRLRVAPNIMLATYLNQLIPPPGHTAHLSPIASAAGSGETISILGLQVPRSAIIDKAGSVTATIALYTLYPALVVLMISVAVYWDMKATGDGKWSPSTRLEFVFLGASVAAMTSWVCQGYLVCMAPAGISTSGFLRVRFFLCECVTIEK